MPMSASVLRTAADVGALAGSDILVNTYVRTCITDSSGARLTGSTHPSKAGASPRMRTHVRQGAPE